MRNSKNKEIKNHSDFEGELYFLPRLTNLQINTRSRSPRLTQALSFEGLFVYFLKMCA